MANQITLIGNVVADPELKLLNDGTSIASFRVASNSSRKQGEQWVEEGTLWVSVSAWGKLGERAVANLSKGTKVIVQGPIKNRQWTNKDGEVRDSIEMRADAIGVDIFSKNMSEAGENNGANNMRSNGNNAANSSFGGGEEEPPF